MVLVHMSIIRGVVSGPNENGGVSMNGPAVGAISRKWKHRNVSAVREFPPGCGPFVQPVSEVVVKEAEAALSLGNDNNIETRVVENQAGSKEEVTGMVNDVVKVDDVKLLSSTNGVDNGVVKEDVMKVKFPRRRVSAIRDFPPFCGYNAGEPSEEERERITGRRSEIGDKGGGEGRNVKVVEAKVAGGDESNVSLKEDLPKKRKSDDLSNEGVVTNQEAEMLMAGEKSNISVENEKVKKIERDVTGVERGKRVHNIGQACQELVVYARDKVVMRRCSDDEDSEEEKFQDERIKSHEMREKVSMLVNRSFSGVQRDTKNIPFRSEGYERFVKKRPLDDTNDLRFDGDRLRCVLGLKASSLGAPGSLKKDLTIKEKGGQASMMPKSFTNKKLKNEDVWEQSSSTRKVGYTGTLEMVVMEEDDFAVDTEEQGAALKYVLGLKAPSLCAPGNPGKYYTTKAKGIQASTTPNNSTKKKQKSQEKAVRREESSSTGKVAYTGTLEMVVRKEDDFAADTKEQDEYRNSQGACAMDVSVPPFGPKSSNDARNKVRETLRLYQAICRKILQGEEAKTNELTSGASVRRVDLAAKTILDKKGRALDLGPKTYGPVAGVEVGDEFLYRVELALVGLHRPYQGGIDYVKQCKEIFAVSVVASGGYDNEIDKPNCLVYSGAGGVTKDKNFENQKLERGNLALKNNIDLKYPVRVIRGYKVTTESVDSKPKTTTTYIYDGLYTVDKCKQVPGPNGNMVFRFELNRIPGQPELAIREVKSKKFKKREGICVNDITNGKEVFPICAVNTIDDEKPPSFTYITKIVYPDWYQPVPPRGCDCVGRCTNKKCSCAFKNGGEIPYNHNGAIVEAKPLVYECGPSCRCPPSCYNRVTQHGMKIHLEIFKTESRGWGVRSLSSISSGSFICEYIGELLEDTEAEKRTGNDEYLFDIGQNYSDCYPNPEMKSDEIVCSGGFTIDALNYGNVGRFINHSCSPNLYAQNVLYDQEDKRMPHIMLFAAENIPPLQELTYHYNYMVNTVHDSDGNIKVKNCYCGSSECTGRLY